MQTGKRFRIKVKVEQKTLKNILSCFLSCIFN